MSNWLVSLLIDGIKLSASNPAPVTIVSSSAGGDASAANQVTTNSEIGSLTEAAPGTDTGSSGLNGRLQRIAQNVTTLIGRLPTTIGQKAKAAALAVTLASDEDLLTYVGNTTDAVVAAGAAGSLAAKLRAISRDIVANIVLAAGANRIGTVGSDDKFIEVTPTLDTAIYAAGDVLFVATAIPSANVSSGRPVTLQSIVLIDKDDIGLALDLYFFDRSVTSGAFNGAPSISDADLAFGMGSVSIGTNDYKDLGGGRMATIRGIGLEMKPNTTDLYFFGVLPAGTPTYTASGLIFKFGFLDS